MPEEKKSPYPQQGQRMGNRHRGGGGGPLQPPGARPKNARKTLGRLFSYLLHFKWRILIALLLMFASTASSLAGTYMLKPLLDNYILPGDFAGLLRGLLFLGGVYLLGSVAMLGQSQIMTRVAQKSIFRIRNDLFSHLQTLPLRFFDQRSHGDLMSLFTNDVDTVQMALEQSVLQLLSSAIMFVGSIAVMLVLSWQLTLVTLGMLVIMVFTAQAIGKRSGKYFIQQQASIAALNGYIEEMMEGQKVLKVFNRERRAIDDFEPLNESYRAAATNAQSFAGVIMPVMGNLNNVNYALTALVGGLLTIFTSFTIGSLSSFLTFSKLFGQPISQVTNQMNNILAALAGAERIFSAMDETPELDEGKVTLVRAKKDDNGALTVAKEGEPSEHWAWKLADGTLVELNGDVRFHSVNFGYTADKEVLHGVSLYAKPGQKIAFVGSTGAGKTTITNLINRFYDVGEGQITYDGIDVRAIKKADLRHSLIMVLQDTHLFSGTIADNIRYGRLDATDEEVHAAAKLASADSFIRHLPQGYDTEISGDGGNLSQGQRQLLAIARAAVASPPVLILDEATSSIDTRTEKQIDKGMDALMGGRTVFVIAHRLSTVRDANAIMVMEDGTIIERGDHDDLLEQKGRYYQLYTGQFELT